MDLTWGWDTYVPALRVFLVGLPMALVGVGGTNSSPEPPPGSSFLTKSPEKSNISSSSSSSSSWAALRLAALLGVFLGVARDGVAALVGVPGVPDLLPSSLDVSRARRSFWMCWLWRVSVNSGRDEVHETMDEASVRRGRRERRT